MAGRKVKCLVMSDISVFQADLESDTLSIGVETPNRVDKRNRDLNEEFAIELLHCISKLEFAERMIKRAQFVLRRPSRVKFDLTD